MTWTIENDGSGNAKILFAGRTAIAILQGIAPDVVM